MKPAALITLLPLASLLLAAAPAPASEPPHIRQVIRQTEADTVTDWERGTLEVTGRGFARATGNAAQDEMLAQEAARAVAYARLAERVDGVRVTASSTIGGAVAAGRIVETQVQAVITGAREVGRRVWTQEDGRRAAEVTLRLCLTSAGQDCTGTVQPVTAVVAPPPVTAVVAPPPARPEPAPSVPAPAVPALHTGLVINVGKLPYLPVLRPEVVAANRSVVFNAAKVSRQVVANEGAAQYAGNLADARKKPQAGSNPLVIQAIGLTDDNRIIVSDADAKLVAQANASAGDFFTSGKVVISFDG
jgi:hypothetical protein